MTAATSATHASPDGYFIFDNAHTVWWVHRGGGADAIALAKLTGVASLRIGLPAGQAGTVSRKRPWQSYLRRTPDGLP